MEILNPRPDRERMNRTANYSIAASKQFVKLQLAALKLQAATLLAVRFFRIRLW